MPEDAATKFVDNQIKDAQKNLDKLKKNGPKDALEFFEYQRNVAEHEKQLAEAQKLLDYWNAVKAEHERVKAEEAKAESEQTKAEEQPKTEEAKTEDNKSEEVEQPKTEESKEEQQTEELKEEDQVPTEEAKTEEQVPAGEAPKQTEQGEVSEGQGTTVGESNQGSEQGEEVNNPKPIGKGFFGNIYDQFRGKVKAAFDFLLKNKSGDLLGVFHRNEVGDIDLVWGDKGGGLDHIIYKHVGEGKSFSNLNEAIQVIDDIIKTGKKDYEDGDKIVFKKGNRLVTIRKNFRNKGKKIADKNWILTAYDELSADGVVSTIAPTNQGQAVRTTEKSQRKGKKKNKKTQAEESKKDFSTKKKKQKVNTTESLSKDSGLHIGKGNGKSVVNPNGFLPTKKEIKEFPFRQTLVGVLRERYCLCKQWAKISSNTM